MKEQLQSDKQPLKIPTFQDRDKHKVPVKLFISEPMSLNGHSPESEEQNRTRPSMNDQCVWSCACLCKNLLLRVF